MLAPDECPGHIWIAYGPQPGENGSTPRKRCRSSVALLAASEGIRGTPKETRQAQSDGRKALQKVRPVYGALTAQANRHKCWGKMTKRKQAGKWDRIPAALAEAFKGRETGRTEAA